MLGEALSSEQLSVVFMSALFWEALRRACIRVLEKYHKPEVAKELATCIVGSVHAIAACVLSARVIASEPRPESVYERFELSQFTYAVSSGYFAWDLYFLLFKQGKRDPAFLLHAAACFLCYTFGQYPFLNYWGLYFLLFELSTPFMYLRRALLLLVSKDSKWIAFSEMSFAITFFFARILVGFPMSALVWRDLLALLKTPEKVHSKFVVYYYLAANAALCSLNVFWFSTIIRKGLAKSTKGKSQ